MKLVHKKPSISDSNISARTIETVVEILSEWHRHKFSLYIFLAMCLNLILAPVVYAATDERLSHFQAWSLGLLGLTAVALSIYLFFVMFVPERF
ncbi:MAG: potassium-transporting ATPase subunit F [Calothrix sp. C42_A2020_038]|nr:potassium-transporting ATPase subunit F [Calothrix sp. C42_A2020_038]